MRDMGDIHPGIPQGLRENERYTPGYTSGLRRKREIYTRVYLRVEERERYTPGYTSGLKRETVIHHPGIPQG